MKVNSANHRTSEFARRCFAFTKNSGRKVTRLFKRKANLQREGLWLPDIFREFSDRLLYCFPQITHNVCRSVLGKNQESLHANG